MMMMIIIMEIGRLSGWLTETDREMVETIPHRTEQSSQPAIEETRTTAGTRTGTYNAGRQGAEQWPTIHVLY